VNQTVICRKPPLFDEIAAAFDLAGQKPIFAWGSVIYNPHAITIPACLFVHEGVHGERQGSDVEGWWRRYIAEPPFRLDEEIPAHQAEYRAFCDGRDRNARRIGLHHIAKRLASPLYGRMVSYDRARQIIKTAA
jgi:hypothetical protein